MTFTSRFLAPALALAALLAPSGLAAIAMVDLALLKAGDDFLIPDNVYNPNRELANWLQKDFGITARFYDPLVGDAIADLIQPNTKLIWVEAPPQDAGWDGVRDRLQRAAADR